MKENVWTGRGQVEQQGRTPPRQKCCHGFLTSQAALVAEMPRVLPAAGL